MLSAVLCVEVAKGAKEGPTGLCLLVLTGLLKSQGGHASLPPKTLKVRQLSLVDSTIYPKSTERY